MDSKRPVANDIAVLAPVPRPILLSAEQDSRSMVAFGSDKADFWLRMPSDRLRVLIYESDRGEDPLLAVSWEATYEFWKDPLEAQRDPELAACRPTAAATDWSGLERNEWLIWWFCSDLRRLEPPIDLKTLTTLRGCDSPRRTSPVAQNSSRLRRAERCRRSATFVSP